MSADLAIFGQPQDVYDAYARSVRAEYAHVEEAAYRAGRANILRHFLGQQSLYADEYFADMYDEQARDNLQRELATLA